MVSADPEPALTQRQQLALVALLSAHSVAATAHRSGTLANRIADLETAIPEEKK